MNKQNLEAQWITGFTDGEGCFSIEINYRKDGNYQVLPSFTITQHFIDIQSLHKIKNYFGFGVVRKNNGERYSYRVRKRDDLINTIIPFFEKHPLKTSKRIDFVKFRYIVNLMQTDQHLTPEGLEKIQKIRSTMNREKYRAINAYLRSKTLT
jgi:hypothetical protein